MKRVLLLIVLALVYLNMSSGFIDIEEPKIVQLVAPNLYNEDDFEELIKMLKKWEGYREYPYPDASGYAVGYGHHIKKKEWDLFKNGVDSVSADTLLRHDYMKFLNFAYKRTGLKNRQLLAVSALMFNTGYEDFLDSRLLFYIKNENNEMIKAEWLKWCHYRKDSVEIVKSSHLLMRRKWEVNFFMI